MFNQVMSSLYTITAEWDLGTFLENAKMTMEKWGGAFIMLLGVIMIVVAVYQTAKGLMSPQKAQTNWLIVFFLFILGGGLVVGGYDWVFGIAKGGKKTVDDFGGAGGAANMIIPMIRSFRLR